MNKHYHVVWLDDDFEKLEPLAIAAEDHGISLHGFRSFEEAFAYLEPNLQQVDAVLLDARFFEKREQVAGTEDLKGLRRAWDRLNQLDGQRKLPRFILSGQTRYQNDDTFAETYGRHYRKSSPGDVAQLWQDIKAAADQQPLTQLRHRYADAFDACKPELLGEEAARYLLDVLQFLQAPPAGRDGHEFLNRLRQLVETLFWSAHRLGLLADECVPNGKINLRWACLFLSGREVSQQKGATRTVRPAAAVFPPRLAQALTDLLNVTNSASHVEQEQQTTRSLLSQTSPHTPYLLGSLTYQLLDLLVWYSTYAAEHPDAATNRAAWVYPEASSENELIAPPVVAMLSGRVDAINPKGFGYFLEDGKSGRDNTNWISNHLVSAHELHPGDRIRVSVGGPQPDSKPPKVVKVERL